jgi:hypothetical protein
MKKTITTITLAATLALANSVFADGIIVAGGPIADNCKAEQSGIIVAGNAILGATFGIIVAGNPVQCVETDGIIVAG